MELRAPAAFRLNLLPPSVSPQLPKDQCTESFEKSILRLLRQGEQTESRDVEKNLRYDGHQVNDGVEKNL